MLKLILLSVLGVMGLALPLTLILTAKEKPKIPGVLLGAAFYLTANLFLNVFKNAWSLNLDTSVSTVFYLITAVLTWTLTAALFFHRSRPASLGRVSLIYGGYDQYVCRDNGWYFSADSVWFIGGQRSDCSASCGIGRNIKRRLCFSRTAGAGSGTDRADPGFPDSGSAVPVVIRRQFGEAAGRVWSGIVPLDGDSIWKMGNARQLHRLWNGTGGTSGAQ